MVSATLEKQVRDERQMELETEEMKVELESSIEGVEMNREKKKCVWLLLLRL